MFASLHPSQRNLRQLFLNDKAAMGRKSERTAFLPLDGCNTLRLPHTLKVTIK